MIEIKDLKKSFGDLKVLKGIDQTINDKEVLCVIGPSGGGKSTFLRCLNRLETPDSGKILLDGVEITENNIIEIREKMGMVFQNPGSSFNPIRSYKKQFIETLKSHGMYEKGAFLPQVAEAFNKLGLTDVERIINSCPYEMSGGMNQRIAMAITLILGQEILLADEPTSALDATIQMQMANELRHLRDVTGISQIIVTHNLALAEYLGDRIAVMYSGRVVELGEASTVLHDARHPYTKSLIAAIPALDGMMPVGLSGSPPMTGPAETGCEFSPRCKRVGKGCQDMTYSLADVGNGHFVSCPCAKGGAE